MTPAEPIVPAELIGPERRGGAPPYFRRASLVGGSSTRSGASSRGNMARSRSSSAVTGRSRRGRGGGKGKGKGKGIRARLGLAGVARRTLGIAMLMVTVFLWTASNFLASYIFADDTYSKPFFVVYLNTSVFAVSLVPRIARFVLRNGAHGTRAAARALWREGPRAAWRWRGARTDAAAAAAKLRREGEEEGEEEEEPGSLGRAGEDDVYDGGEGEGAGDSDSQRLLVDDEEAAAGVLGQAHDAEPGEDVNPEKLSLRSTAWLSLEFCMLWFAANYFASACLEHTSVGSATVFTSLSGVFTLLFGSLRRVEPFSLRKLAGVLASLAGVALISSADLSGASDEDRGSFPHKDPAEVALGDAMALLSAAVYGVYVTVMKGRVGSEDRVDMPLFFGLVGLFNVVMLWPGFVVLHLTGIETFELPPTGRVWTIIILNSFASFVSDMTWAYAMLLTTPLVVTVGLSLTIPLSLLGEMVQYAQYSSWVYWVGAAAVVVSFLFINHETRDGKGVGVEEDGEEEEEGEEGEEGEGLVGAARV